MKNGQRFLLTVLVMLVLITVWPTPYRYMEVGGGLGRLNRFTGTLRWFGPPDGENDFLSPQVEDPEEEEHGDCDECTGSCESAVMYI